MEEYFWQQSEINSLRSTVLICHDEVLWESLSFPLQAFANSTESTDSFANSRQLEIERRLRKEKVWGEPIRKQDYLHNLISRLIRTFVALRNALSETQQQHNRKAIKLYVTQNSLTIEISQPPLLSIITIRYILRK